MKLKFSRRPVRCIIVSRTRAGVRVQSANTAFPQFIPKSAFDSGIYKECVPGLALDVVFRFDHEGRWTGKVEPAQFYIDTIDQELEELRRQVALNNAQQVKRRVEKENPKVAVMDKGRYSPKNGFLLVCTHSTGKLAWETHVTAEDNPRRVARDILARF